MATSNDKPFNPSPIPGRDAKPFTTEHVAQPPAPTINPPTDPKKINTAPDAVTATMVATIQASMEDNIVAAPLDEPDFTMQLRPKNPGISLRWVLHTLYKSDGSQNTLRFEQARSQGFRVVTKNDLQNPPQSYERDGGAKYINGDLILMCMDRRKYQGAILHREQKAAKQMASTRQAGAKEVQHNLAGQPASQTSKVSVFNPMDNELKEFLNSDVGDVEPKT